MSRLDRRQVFLALAALAAAPTAARASALPQIEPKGARLIGEAYLAQRGGKLDAGRLTGELLPRGWNPHAAARLKARVARDFRDNRIFVHRGWRLSDTEGRLFALAALSQA